MATWSVSSWTATTTRSMRNRTRRCRSAGVVVVASHNSGMSRAQCANLFLFGPRQRRGLRAAKTLVLLLQTPLFGQRLLPASFQFPCHQAVLRIDRLVLPRRAIRLVTRAFELLLPMLVESLPFLGHIGSGGQMEFQSGGFQNRQHLGAHQRIQTLARQTLTRRFAIIDGGPRTTVAEPLAVVGVSDQQASATPTTNE